MNLRHWSLLVTGCISTEAVLASETNTLHLDSSAIPKQTFIARWEQELTPAGLRIVYDRFGPPSDVGWINAYDLRRYGIHDFLNSRGRNATTDIMGSAAREAAVDTLPLGEYEDLGRGIGRVIIHFVRGSIGNTEEEDVRIVSTTPSYGTLRHIANFEWISPEKAWTVKYGSRPLRDRPYFYLINNFGHYEDRQFIHTEVRCYGYIFHDFGLVKVESQAIITLGRQTQLVLGGAIYPTDMSSIEHQSSASIRWETVAWNGILSIGGATSRTEDSCSINWSWNF